MKSLLLALLLLLGSINCYCQVLRVDGDPFEGNARPNAGLGFDNNNHRICSFISIAVIFELQKKPQSCS